MSSSLSSTYDGPSVDSVMLDGDKLPEVTLRNEGNEDGNGCTVEEVAGDARKPCSGALVASTSILCMLFGAAKRLGLLGKEGRRLNHGRG